MDAAIEEIKDTKKPKLFSSRSQTDICKKTAYE